MSRLPAFALAVLFPVALAAAEEPDPEPQPPAHLRGQPRDLSMRANGKIVEAPAELLKLARSYATYGDKGNTTKGRRITILADKLRCKVGDKVRIIHALEAVKPGITVYVMGPKPVYSEYVDGRNVRPGPSDAEGIYDGRILHSPVVDFHYDITAYTFSKPGKHTIQWKGGGHPIEGNLRLESNVLTITVEK